jgi:predicted Ser/Thr protein kinase
MMMEPDERFLRLIESRIGIKENEAEGWRKTIWLAWCDGKNTLLLDARLGEVFLQMAIEYQMINRTLMTYPNTIYLSDT